MEEKFKIKSYGYGELAQLYFPKASKRSASVQFRRWIVFNKKLENELLKNGFQPGLRLLTPKQVKLIVDYLGEPN
jgi:hypothetical protein